MTTGGDAAVTSASGRAVLVCRGCGAGHSLFTVEQVTVLYPVVVVAGLDELPGEGGVEVAEHVVQGAPDVECCSQDPAAARGAWYTGGSDHRIDGEGSWPRQAIQCRACGWDGTVEDLVPAAVGQWSYHQDVEGRWCRWSLTSTAARGEDAHCPSGCPASEVEVLAAAVVC